MQARFVRFEWENDTKTIGTIYLRADKPYYFTAGQYADIIVPHANPDARGQTRTMTFSSSSSDKLLAFTTRLGGRTSTYKQALLALQPDNPMTITDAMGDLVLPLDESMPLVFVAGGLGIASYVGMVRWLTEQQDRRDITLLYAVRNTDDIMFSEAFDAYALQGDLTTVLYTTDSKASSYGWNGTLKNMRLTSAEIMAYVKPEAQVYVSGSESFVNQLVGELLHTHKLPQYRLVFDFFDGYSEL